MGTSFPTPIERMLESGMVYIGGGLASQPYQFENLPSANEVRADGVIDQWKNSKGGWKKLRKLIIAALDEALDDADH